MIQACSEERQSGCVATSSTGPISKSPAYRFATADFPERERVSAWREVFGRTVVNLDITPIGDGPFQSNATACLLPGFGVLFGATSAVDLRHTRELIKDDDLSFMIGPNGKWAASQLGRDALLTSGDGVLMWNSEVGAMTLPSSMLFMTFRVPVAAIAPLVPDVSAVVARRIPRTTEGLRLLTHYIGSLRDSGALAAPELQTMVVAHVQDLLGLLLGATRDAAEIAIGRGLRVARLRAIKADVRERLSRVDLAVGEVAARHQLTPRYVQLLFEGEGTTFSEFLLGQRLACADRMLRDRRFDHRSITSVAFDVGIPDPSYFGRLFRRRFGRTPSEARGDAAEARRVLEIDVAGSMR